MKAGVIVFPGSNCDQDLVDALHIAGFQNVVKLWHKSSNLEDCQFVFVPGGFSYGDYLRSGAIARFSPIMKEVTAFANNGGFVLGICNGFQILTEAGLLPGALLRNQNQLFICETVALEVANSTTWLTNGLQEGQKLKIPIAHGEGRFYCPEKELERLEGQNQILFRYADKNPNGSLNNIAGIVNDKGNVFGMMPHPERVTDPRLGQNDGAQLFKNLLEQIPV
jgi:phosphoribosylformylglycinamidine synthase subunit PurQ / glutaminase